MTIRVLILSLSFLLASAYLAKASKNESVPARQSLSELPIQIQKWTASDASPLDVRVLRTLQVDDYINRVYSTDGANVGLYIGFYRSQREGSAIHSPMNCLPGAGWNPADRKFINVRVSGPSGSVTRDIEVNRILIEKGLDKQVVLYWYQSHGRIVASEYWGKIYTVLDTIRLNRTDAGLVRIISPVSRPGLEAERSAEIAAVEFAQSLFPLLSTYLPD